MRFFVAVVLLFVLRRGNRREVGGCFVLVVFFLIWGAFYADRMAIQSPATPPWSQEEVSLNNLI